MYITKKDINPAGRYAENINPRSITLYMYNYAHIADNNDNVIGLIIPWCTAPQCTLYGVIQNCFENHILSQNLNKGADNVGEKTHK